MAEVVGTHRTVGTVTSGWRTSYAGELWAEFFGCFILISFGDGVVAMLWALVGSGRSSAGALQSSGDWPLITWGWMLAVAFAVYVAGGISGAHINPAISLGAAIRKQLPWGKVPGYWSSKHDGTSRHKSRATPRSVGARVVFMLAVCPPWLAAAAQARVGGSAHRWRSRGVSVGAPSSSSSPGGSSVNSQPPSTGIKVPCFTSSASAVLTVGRRAATRSARTECVRFSGSRTPSGRTCPQRPARCQSNIRSRTSTRG